MANLGYIGAGEFNEIVTIQTATSARNTYGEDEETFTTVGEEWAKVIHSDGSEKIQDDKMTVLREIEIYLHYRSDITTKSRIIYDGSAYNVLNILPVNRRRYLKLICEDRD